MTGTADINAINLQVYAPAEIAAAQADGSYTARRAADPKAFIWQSHFQTIPQGAETDPVAFARAIRQALPLVNTLRIPFNAWSFNPDGSLDPRFEAFLGEAARQGFHLLFVYMDGEGQRFGSARVPGSDKLTPDQLAAALQGEILDRAKASFGRLADWLGAHPAVKARVWGLELMNEPAAFKTAMLKVPRDDVEGRARFVGLYAQVMVALAKAVEARSDARILVGGFAYSADFNILAHTRLPDGSTALDTIRQGVGPRLVWSAHLYPGWGEPGKAKTAAEFRKGLDAQYGVLKGDDVLVTETNTPEARTYRLTAQADKAQLLAESWDWFADHGIGITWFTGMQPGASTFAIFAPGQPLAFPNLDSYGAGMDAFTQGGSPPGAPGRAVAAAFIPGRATLQKDDPAWMLRGDPTGGATGIAVAAGGSGADTLTGRPGADNFLYGGAGGDSITGAGPQDYLYGQDGNDTLVNPSGSDHLFGGRGNDLFVDLGTGYSELWGGPGGDRFSLGTNAKAVIADYAPEDGDTADFRGRYKSVEELLRHATVLDWNGDGVPDLMLWHSGGGYAIFLGMGDRLLDFARSLAAFPAPSAIPPLTPPAVPGAPFSPATGVNPDGPAVPPEPRPPAATVPPGPGQTVKGARGGALTLGTNGDDVIEGRGEGDLIVSGAGNDLVHEQRGQNTVFAGDGNDTVETGRMASQIVLGTGDDLVRMDLRSAGPQVWLGTGRDTLAITAIGTPKHVGRFVDAQIFGWQAGDAITYLGQPVDLARPPANMTLTLFGSGEVLTVDGFARLFLYPPGAKGPPATDDPAEVAFDPRFDPADPGRHLR